MTQLGEDFVKVEDVQRYLGVSRTTAYQWVRSGRIPSVRVGNVIRIPVAELKRCLESGVTSAGKEGAC